MKQREPVKGILLVQLCVLGISVLTSWKFWLLIKKIGRPILDFLFIYLGCAECSSLHMCVPWFRRTGASLRCGARAPSVAASLAGEHRLSAQALAAAACGLSSCCSWALEHGLSSFATRVHLLQGMWSLPGPGIEPMSLPSRQMFTYCTTRDGLNWLLIA